MDPLWGRQRAAVDRLPQYRGVAAGAHGGSAARDRHPVFARRLAALHRGSVVDGSAGAGPGGIRGRSFAKARNAADARLVAYTISCAVITTVLCGLYPAVRATRRTLAGSLALSSRTQVSGGSPLQWLLVGMQV